MQTDILALMLVTNKGATPTTSYINFIENCVKAGITSVQLREKNLTKDNLLSFGLALKQLLDKYNIPLIINDDVDLCQEIGADGVHLGQSDTAISQARANLGTNKIIGLSTNTMQQIASANDLPVDYLGVGAIFPTNNKTDIETFWGVANLHQANLASSKPIVAIGGINIDNIISVIAAGVTGVAAIGAFHDNQDPYSTTKDLIAAIRDGRHDK